MSGRAEPETFGKLDAYWRAANYLSVGQMYLYDNPLLERPLVLDDVKRMLLGHWGTTPGQNFVYAHLNRVIRKYDLDMIYVCGPGHGGPAVVANTYLEGTYSEVYPDVTRDTAGLRTLFRRFSFPGGIPSHASPETPGSIHEGGELGYSLSHSFGAAFDNPDLVVACVVGDGEAETGPLATAWHSNKFLDPATDGAVLPILHLNGYKIASPTVLARITHEELDQLLRGYGWTPYFVEGHDPALMHEAMAAALDIAVEHIRRVQGSARRGEALERPRWPMIVLRSPKGWTGPSVVDGKRIEGTFRSHQVPLSDPRKHPEHLALLQSWLESCRPRELFDLRGRLLPELADLAPKGDRRMGANPHANGGGLLVDLRLPVFQEYALAVDAPGAPGSGDTRALGRFLRDVVTLNEGLCQSRRPGRVTGGARYAKIGPLPVRRVRTSGPFVASIMPGSTLSPRKGASVRQTSVQRDNRSARGPLRLSVRALVFASLARRKDSPPPPPSNRSAAIGALAGAAACALFAILASQRLVVSSWLEPFVTIGAFFSALNGAAIGATFGAFFGALLGLATKDAADLRADVARAGPGTKPLSSSSTALRIRRIFARRTRATRLHDMRAARWSAVHS